LQRKFSFAGFSFLKRKALKIRPGPFLFLKFSKSDQQICSFAQIAFHLFFAIFQYPPFAGPTLFKMPIFFNIAMFLSTAVVLILSFSAFPF